MNRDSSESPNPSCPTEDQSRQHVSRRLTLLLLAASSLDKLPVRLGAGAQLERCKSDSIEYFDRGEEEVCYERPEQPQSREGSSIPGFARSSLVQWAMERHTGVGAQGGQACPREEMYAIAIASIVHFEPNAESIHMQASHLLLGANHK